MNTEYSEQQRATIAQRNDAFRRTLENCTVTRGIATLGNFVHDVCYAVRHYTEFTEDNDPFGEHDFGSSYTTITRLNIDFLHPDKYASMSRTALFIAIICLPPALCLCAISSHFNGDILSHMPG